MLPKLLPNGSRNPSKRFIDLRRRVVVKLLGDMTVNVQRHRDGRMTQTLLRNLGMDPGQKELGRVSVPDGMKMHWKVETIGKPAEVIGQHVRQDWAAIRSSAD